MLTTNAQNGILIVKFNGVKRFNVLITDPVKEELISYFSTPNTKLVLSLEGVEFVDSTGFGVFLSVLKKADTNQGRFKIAAISGEVMELFKLLQLHNVFEIYNTVEDAVSSFEKQSL